MYTYYLNKTKSKENKNSSWSCWFTSHSLYAITNTEVGFWWCGLTTTVLKLSNFGALNYPFQNFVNIPSSQKCMEETTKALQIDGGFLDLVAVTEALVTKQRANIHQIEEYLQQYGYQPLPVEPQDKTEETGQLLSYVLGVYSLIFSELFFALFSETNIFGEKFSE